ncbi:hypothetical protein PICMEDRAFT_169111 [Pichia membranifaciens NRRL Y-2026]|uniref:Uncharacterized protein n=1 Tax=Pichia membranifaciens NRRL Y-2026 TaxID=763406 RepID=A0A1E3NGM8_9ASCO|nr:hypothetical protein PICMEDRAFT_169111 [Pichia membranifaciens NRRL Y-2026]ODQ45269.1 hypothetical protein PICMEDRAFT_169111 [Pichia membranifaciens NRRL Y-2026]
MKHREVLDVPIKNVMLGEKIQTLEIFSNLEAHPVLSCQISFSTFPTVAWRPSVSTSPELVYLPLLLSYFAKYHVLAQKDVSTFRGRSTSRSFFSCFRIFSLFLLHMQARVGTPKTEI